MRVATQGSDFPKPPGRADAKLRVDLRGADLRGTNLSGANLSDAHLDGANFFKAVLDRADLSGAFLNGAQFLNCAQLIVAQNWQSTFRDDALACGASIPDRMPSDQVAEDSTGSDHCLYAQGDPEDIG